MSEAEPEMGIGFVQSVDALSVELSFPAAARTRRYNKRTSPLRRLEFRVGDTIKAATGESWHVEKIDVRKGLNWYVGPDGRALCEAGIYAQLKLQRPLERLLAGQVDPLGAYLLRLETLGHRERILRSAVRGLVGPRVMLLPHQAYVVSQVSSRGLPRALLADEVGLGKTIEAGWILHQLIVTERVRRVLLIVPQALVNQWFVEMLRRFNLSFWVPDAETNPTLTLEDFQERERFILSIESLEDPIQSEALLQTEWDMIVVDEAHRIDWSEEDPSLEYVILKAMSNMARGVLLLTATPEQLGLEGHFGRLQLVDPQRFPSWDAFEKEHDQYQEVVALADALLSDVPISKEITADLKARLKGKLPAATLSNVNAPEHRREVLLALVDYYGTGRIYFRNSRRVVQLEDFAFPKRHLHTYPLGEVEPAKREDVLVVWLAELLKKYPQDKVLLLCTSAKTVVRLKERLLNEHALKAVEFHEQMQLLARDRNAAYFEDPDGARILLSSEIGGEGRNFQAARHLVLFDLPLEPDVLEQRIGRLDRIGQKHDIEIHVPFIEHTVEAVLLRWYQTVFNAFEGPASGAGPIHELLFERLEKFLLKPAMPGGMQEEFEKLLSDSARSYQKAVKAIEAGRDRLIEINSFDAEHGKSLTEQIQMAERSGELKAYLEKIFDGMGIHVEKLGEDAMFVEPGDSMFAEYFPALPPEGIRMTFSRERAVVRDDLTLMSWDHPMVTDTIDSVFAQEFGNVSLGCIKAPAQHLLVEANFLLEAISDAQWNADEFLPCEPLRVVVDARAAEVATRQWPFNKIHDVLSPPTKEQIMGLSKMPANALRALLKTAQTDAEKTAAPLVAAAMTKMEMTIDAEIKRLKTLQGKNRLVSDREIDWWKDRKKKLKASFEKAGVRLDSLCFVLVGF